MLISLGETDVWRYLVADNQYDEIEIDLVAVLWRMAAQWKLVLVAGMICGLLFGVFSYWSDYRKYQNELLGEDETVQEGAESEAVDDGASAGSESADSQTTDMGSRVADFAKTREQARKDFRAGDIEEDSYPEYTEDQEDDLTEDEKITVDQLVDRQKEYEKYADYVRSSFLTDIDPYNKQVLYMRYRLTPKGDALIEEAGETVAALLKSSDTMDEISKSLAQGTDSRYVQELFAVNLTGIRSEPKWHEIKNEAILELSAVVLPKISVDEWEAAIEDAVRHISESDGVSESVDVDFLGKRTQISIDTDLLSKQNTADNTLRDNDTEIKTAVRAMSDEQLDYYGDRVTDSGVDDEYFASERNRRDTIAEKISDAIQAAAEAEQAASDAQETAAALTEAALQAEEKAELSATEAEEAAAAAVRAKEKEKEAKAESRLATGKQKEAEAKEDTEAAQDAADEAQKTAQRAEAAAQVSKQASEAAEAAAGELDTAVSLRQKAQEASESATQFAQKARERADAALEAAQAAQNAVDLTEAANAAAEAALANGDALMAAEEAEQVAAEVGTADDGSDDENIAEDDIRPSVSVSKLALGAICGVFLYGMLLVCWIIFRPTVCEETCSSLLFDRRTIRVRRMEEPTGFLNWLLDDVHVWRWRNRRVPTFDRQMEDAVSAIRFFLHRDDAANPVLVAVNGLTESSEEILERLSREAGDGSAAFGTVVLDGEDRKRYFDEVERLESVFLVSEYGKTKVKVLQNALDDMRHFGIRCEGHVVLGG